jgi:hypothetical protein
MSSPLKLPFGIATLLATDRSIQYSVEQVFKVVGRKYTYLSPKIQMQGVVLASIDGGFCCRLFSAAELVAGFTDDA